MHCQICKSEITPYFIKRFETFDLGDVEYYKCQNCGYVISKTHIEMDKDSWNKLNQAYHSYHTTDTTEDDRNWVLRLTEQAKIITELSEFGILPHTHDWVDYGCGDGKLSKLLSKNSISLSNFDIWPCSNDTKYISQEELTTQQFDLVATTSVLEHLRSYEEIENIFNLVSSTGVLAIHTFISSTVPQDPNWFYLLPVHCAFQTNASMKILFDRWNFEFSIYNYDARMWFLFKKPPNVRVLDGLNKITPGKYHFKFDFMDYWK